MSNHLIYFLIALVGIAFQIAKKMQALQGLAKKANLIWHPLDYFKDDWLSVLTSLLTVVLCVLFLPDIEIQYPGLSHWYRIIFAFIGFTGAAFMDWIFSQAKNRLESAVDHKTTIADEATGNADAPTPAVKPQK